MNQSPNQIRARKRNCVRGALAIGKGGLKELISNPAIFSNNEIAWAQNALFFLSNCLISEPRNYISQRYPNERKRRTSGRTNPSQPDSQPLRVRTHYISRPDGSTTPRI